MVPKSPKNTAQLLNTSCSPSAICVLGPAGVTHGDPVVRGTLFLVPAARVFAIADGMSGSHAQLLLVL